MTRDGDSRAPTEGSARPHEPAWAAPVRRELSRRGLLASAGGALLGAAALPRALAVLAAAAEAARGPDVARAAVADSAAVRETIAALADTVVPGPAGRAHPAPGAVEAGAVEEMYDPFYGVADAYGLLHADVQAATPRVLGRPATFDLALPYRDRERVLDERMAYTGRDGGDPLALVYNAAAILAYFAYYGTARSDVGPRAIGFPPASSGYAPRHSYRVRFAGMTGDGNPR